MKFKVGEIIEFLNKYKESDDDIVTIEFCYSPDYDRKGTILGMLRNGEPISTEFCNHELETLYCEEKKEEVPSIEIMLSADSTLETLH